MRWLYDLPTWFLALLIVAIFLVIAPNLGDDGYVSSSSEQSAATGAIVMIYLSGFGWAMGWNSVQYLINAEIYPLRLRALGGSFSMVLHFANRKSWLHTRLNQAQSDCTDKICRVRKLKGGAVHVRGAHNRWHHVLLRGRHFRRSRLG